MATASICHPETDWSCAGGDDFVSNQDPELIERAEAFAWSLLASLTAYQIGTCPITVRPCASRCAPPGSYRTAPVRGGGMAGLPSVPIGMLNPYISGGRWLNACGCRTDCGCESLSAVELPGPVGGIVSVYLDGQEVDKALYRVDNGNQLVRLDGQSWPACQDMAASDEQGFSVTYYRGAAPNVLTTYAAGLLAYEFYLMCSGKDCRLPANLTRMTRQGEAFEFAPADFEGGDTGIPEVNVVIRTYNPFGLKAPVSIASPDTINAGARTATWRG